MSELNRREFVIAATAATACAVCPAILQGAPSQRIDVGALSEYPSNVISDSFTRKPHQILVVRSGERIYAMSAVCTHKGCTVKLKDGQIRCPCHGSVYSETGAATDGPARRSLVRYAISLNDSSRLIVDKSRQFSEPQWDDPASFVRVPL